jgi:phosphoglycolate phosphatase-like HAD superfamily hydrolase
VIKLLIFDWDDVFTLGSKEGYIHCYHETLVELGVKLDPEEEHRRIMAAWSKPHREELRGLLEERLELLDEACEIYEDKFFGGVFVGALTYVDGANDLLERLALNYKLAVATGAHPRVLREQVMPRFGVPKVFAQIVSAYDINDAEKQKPHPHMLERIMHEQGATPDETVMVGDAASDVMMAHNAGVTPVVVLTGHLDREQAVALGVELIVDDVTGVEAVLVNVS